MHDTATRLDDKNVGVVNHFWRNPMQLGDSTSFTPAARKL